MENNEWSFCALWTRRVKVSRCAKVLINRLLGDDYFFNRADISSCSDPAESAQQVARIFWREGLECYVYDLAGNLPEKNLLLADKMHVLTGEAVADVSEVDTSISKVDRSSLSTWVHVFCESFSVPEWSAEVERIMSSNMAKLDLLLAYKDQSPAGCAAIFNHNGATGLYCLGTIAQMRRRGTAEGILKSAMSTSKTGPLFLQTLESEGLLPLYLKAGFRIAYTKKILKVPKGRSR